MTPVQLEITDVAYHGAGIARHEGKVWFVPETVPGDVVLAVPESEKKKYVQGSLTKVVTPSSLRETSPCQHSEECGGCQWLNIPYEHQSDWKKGFILSALKRIANSVQLPELEYLPSPVSINYRNRILLRIHAKDHGVEFGFFKRQSRELVPISECKIADPLINALLQKLNLSLPDLPAENRWRAEIQAFPLTGKCSVTVFPGDRQTQGTEELLKAFMETGLCEWAGPVFDLRDAPILPLQSDGNITWHSFPGQFQQVNLKHNAKMREIVEGIVDSCRPVRVLDVCCGSGNLTLGLAKPGRYIEAIELNKKAIVAGHRNLELNKIDGIKFLVGDGEAHLWKCQKNNEAFDLVILDPPRQGMFKGMIPLYNMKPKDIVYVSCDPTTLARDIAVFIKNGDYKIERLWGLDFFPNTYHVETILWLNRVDS